MALDGLREPAPESLTAKGPIGGGPLLRGRQFRINIHRPSCLSLALVHIMAAALMETSALHVNILPDVIQETQPRQVITIPDLISFCDFPFNVNPNCDAVSIATDEWISSCYARSADRLDKVSSIKAGTLASMAWPFAALPELRGCADFVHMLFHLDDLTDEMGVKDVREVCNIVMDVLYFPDRYTEAVGKGNPPALVTLTYE